MLSVDAGKMHKVDTRNVENLFGMWTGWCSTPFRTATSADGSVVQVFSRCAESMEDGRRLENLSWRIWNRETLCCESQPQFTTTPAIDFSRPRPDRKDIPELSASVDSVASDVAELIEDDRRSRTAPVDIQSQPSRNGGVQGRSRGREKHITSLGLEKMVFSIKEKKELQPLSPRIVDAVPSILPSTDITPRPASAPLHGPPLSSESSTSTAPDSSPESNGSGSDAAGSDTSAEIGISHSVVRGFSPTHISSSYRSSTLLAPSSLPAKPIIHLQSEEPRTGGMFTIGGSSGEDDSSFDDQMSRQPRQSSLTAGLKRPPTSKKQTSFRDEVESRTINHKSLTDEEVFESDDEDDGPGSAIEDDEEEEDDDGSDWEDSISDGGDAPGPDKPLFQRVDSRPNLVSRRSLLTTLMNQSDRAAAFAHKASQSTTNLRRSPSKSYHGSDVSSSPEDEDPLAIPAGSKMTASKPIIMTTPNTHPPALSPRTTRLNMLATEFTESLRKHLLWERQQKSTTANAVLKRRHTAFDVANLQEYPGHRPDQTSKDASRNNSWNHFFDHGLGEYHQAGW